MTLSNSEPELSKWMGNHGPELSLSYKTFNIADYGVDMNEGLTAMAVREGCDVLICYGVLEHVPNDQKALAELFRIIRPAGFLKIYVRQSAYHEGQE